MKAMGWAAIGTGFTFVMTALGAALVFFFRVRISARMNRMCLGFAGGVMSAASVFSLLVPAAEQAQGAPWVVVTVGFAGGVALLAALDLGMGRTDCTQLAYFGDKKRTLLFLAVTLHNIPEGMAVGVALAVAAQSGGTGFAGACALAIGIGVQNFPEGAAISLPMRQGGMSRSRSFGYGVLSGVVEPVFGVLAALLVSSVQAAMPWLMAFAAGAMMAVVFCDMLPEAGEQRDGALLALVGYAVMMALDVALG